MERLTGFSEMSTWTYAEYAALPENGRRFEVIEGSLLEMTAPTLLHQIVSAAFFSAMERALVGTRFRVLFAPVDVVLGSNLVESAQTVVQPDLLILPYGQTASCYLGAPPWVLEILSPSSKHQDQVVKHRLYEKYGVGEYWLMDVENRALTVYRRAGNVFLPGIEFDLNQSLLIHALGICVDLRGLADQLAEQDAIDRDTGLKQ